MEQMGSEGERLTLPGEERAVGPARPDAGTAGTVPPAAPVEAEDGRLTARAVLAVAGLLALGWCYSVDRVWLSAIFVLFGGWPYGLLIIGFFVCLLALRGRRHLSRQARTYLAISVALALVPVLSASMRIRAANGFVLGISCMLAYRAVLVDDDAHWASPADPFRSIAAFVREQFSHIAASLSALRPSSGSRAGWFWPVVGGLVAGVLVLALTVPLLASADSAFGSLVSGVFDALSAANLFTWLRRAVRWLVIALLAASLLWAGAFSATDSTRSSHARAKAEDDPAAGAGAGEAGRPTMATTALLVIDIAYLVFVVVEVSYLFGGAAAEDVAEYARTGFFELVGVTVINLLALAAAISAGERKAASPVLVVCELVLVGVTVVMLASAAWRMGLYVGEYGLSLLRLCVIWAMVAIAACLVLAAIRILSPRFPAFGTGLALVLALWAAFALVRPEAIVADYDVDAYLDGRLEEIDTDYLETLSSDASPARERLEREAGISTWAVDQYGLYTGPDGEGLEVWFWSMQSAPEALGLA